MVTRGKGAGGEGEIIKGVNWYGVEWKINSGGKHTVEYSVVDI